MTDRYDAIVVGAGPNGLSAAIVLAQAGRSVLVREARHTVGGGCRSAELTLPGVVHDVCSAVHPLGVGSPFLRSLPLERHGLRWIEPPIQLAHPLDDGSAGLAYRDLYRTADGFGDDGDAAFYERHFGYIAAHWDDIVDTFLGPIRPGRLIRDPMTTLRFGLPAALPASVLAWRLNSERARGLLAGCAAHGMVRLEHALTGSLAIMLMVSAHTVGWPIPDGGSQHIADALAAHLRELGGVIETDAPVTSLDELPPHRAVLLDLAPPAVLGLAGDRLGGLYARQLSAFQPGPGVFKLDMVLDGPIPWRHPAVAEAGIVHLGGTFHEVAAAERLVAQGKHPRRPFVLVSQPTAFDPSRAPAGQHVVWSYCHVPNGSRVDMTDAIEAQIERFAPGFRDRIVARHAMDSAAIEAYNPNYVGGDIAGGWQGPTQLLTRPALRPDPYSTPDPGIFVCSSSTPPGAGVHGLCGQFAAESALRGILH
jgi:phytoene dehydrogenase-like protein